MPTTSKHRFPISRAHWHPASPIRASRRRISRPRSRGEPSGASGAFRLRQFSCRTTTRSAIARWATGSKASPTREAIEAALAVTAAGAVDAADAVHGRGMGRKGALPVLLRFRRRSRRCGAQGPPRRTSAWAYAEYGDEVPDALDPLSERRRSAVLDWNEPKTPAAQKRLALVRDLLKIRRQEIVPRLADATFGEAAIRGRSAAC